MKEFHRGSFLKKVSEYRPFGQDIVSILNQARFGAVCTACVHVDKLRQRWRLLPL